MSKKLSTTYAHTSISMNKKVSPKTKDPDYESLGKMLVSIYESGYINANQSYKSSFLKGVVSGIGGVVGATIVIGAIAWSLSLFKHIPLLGPITDTVKSSIQEKK